MDRDTTLQRLTRGASLAAAAYVASVGALALSQVAGTTPAWWPAAGIGLAALVRVPARDRVPLAVALALAYGLGNLTMGRPPLVAASLGLFDGVETALGAWLLLRWLPRRRLEGVHDVWKLFAVALVGAAVAGAGIAAALTGDLAADFTSTLLIVVPSHAASVMLLAPLALVPWRRPDTHLGARRLEVAIQAAVLTVVTVLSFGPHMNLTMGFAPLPVLVWAAVRTDERVVALEQALFAVAVTVFTSVGWGPFNIEGRTDGAAGANSTQLAQLYLLCVVLVGLPLAKAMRERERALARASAGERVFRRNFTQSTTPTARISWDGTTVRVEEVNGAARTLLPQLDSDPRGLELGRVLDADDLLRALRESSEPLAGWSGALTVRGDEASALHGIVSLLEHEDGRSDYSLHLADVAGPLQLQLALRAERRYARAVIDTASSVILVTDERGTVLAANPATTRLTGWTEAELLGRPFWEVLLPEDLRVGARRQLLGSGEVPEQGETTLLARDGTLRTIVFSNSVHRDGPDDPRYLVLTAIDVTDARENAGMVAHVLRAVTTIAFIGTDLDGRITLVNPGAERLLGVGSDRARGRELTDFVQAADPVPSLDDVVAHRDAGPPTFDDLLGDPAGAGSPAETRHWVVQPEGRSPVRVSMTSNTVTSTYGAVFAHLFVARDVTETRRSQEILVDALRREREVVARLQDLDRAKDDFVSTVSHELRTPMSSIIGSSEMLADGLLGDLAPEQQRMVEVIVRNSDRLLTLADDLLVLATSDQRPWPDQQVALDLRDAVRESQESVQAQLAGRELDTHVWMPEEPVRVRGERSHLERAISNLVTNAIKFTPDGGRIEVRLERDEVRRQAVVEVSDTGLGIAPEDQEAVFGRFFRSRVVQDRAIQGSGLGLSIVRTIVEHHEGEVHVRSEPGRGSTFTLTLPLVPDAVGRTSGAGPRRPA